MRLHLVCTLSGLPVVFALAGAKAGEQETLLDIFTAEPRLLAERPGQTLIGDKNYFGADLQTQLAQTGAVLLRPAAKANPIRPHRRCSNRCARPSNRSTRRSKASWTWNATAGTPATG
ncbi:MAG TPA: transposase [Streptosporangiaceae bacterium]|nr:transposase [Streptosporangiaceae bacterium]